MQCIIWLAQDSNLLRKFGQLPEWPKGSDCKSDGSRLRRFESSTAHHEPLAKLFQYGRFDARVHGFAI